MHNDLLMVSIVRLVIVLNQQSVRMLYCFVTIRLFCNIDSYSLTQSAVYDNMA